MIVILLNLFFSQFNTVGYYNTLQSRLKQNENTLLNVLKKSAERQGMERMRAQGIPSYDVAPVAEEETQSDKESLEATVPPFLRAVQIWRYFLCLNCAYCTSLPCKLPTQSGRVGGG